MTNTDKAVQLINEVAKMFQKGIIPADTPYNEIADTIMKNYTTKDIQIEVLKEQSDTYFNLYVESQKSIIENIKARNEE